MDACIGVERQASILRNLSSASDISSKVNTSLPRYFEVNTWAMFRPGASSVQVYSSKFLWFGIFFNEVNTSLPRSLEEACLNSCKVNTSLPRSFEFNTSVAQGGGWWL